MSDSIELDKDLEYLQIKYSIDFSIVAALKESPESAQKYIRSYKAVRYIICLIFMLLGLTLIVSAFLLPIPRTGILSGMVGAVMLYYFANDLVKKQKALREIERIASYHGLLYEVSPASKNS